MDEVDVSVSKIEDDIIYFTSKFNNEMSLYIPAIKDYAQYAYDILTDQLRVITWDQVINLITTGIYSYSTEATVKFVTCDHNNEPVDPVLMGDGEYVYVCPVCRHVLVSLLSAINLHYIVIDPTITKLTKGYYVVTNLRAILHEDGSVKFISGG